MSIVDSLLPEFDHEMTTTRKLLERVPEDRLDWKPHAKSTTLGGLATHVANLPVWGAMTVNQTELDLAEAGVAELARTRAELLARFDANVANARTALIAKSDATNRRLALVRDESPDSPSRATERVPPHE
jgi:hypothetical protein